ncbi:histone deacetylase [Acidobacteriota bacterium]
MKTGVLRDNRYMEHDMGDFHPENPRRLEVIYRMLDEEISFDYSTIEPRIGTDEEIQWIHTESHVHAIKKTSGIERVMLDLDTSTSARSYEVATLAVGGVLKTAELIMNGDITNAFAFIRPPGHHAEASQAMGFCLFNNIAVAAEYLQRKHGLKRILIVDWDLHHGNGTQHSFEQSKDILYFSTHQFPHYPGTGHWSEKGDGEGEGYTVNVPLRPGKTDQDYIYIFEKVLSPIAGAFEPEFILVSAGFDIYEDDPLGGMLISDRGFGAMTFSLLQMAKSVCQDRILFALEGGYSSEGLSSGSKQALLQLSGQAQKPDIDDTASSQTLQELQSVLEIHRKHWPLQPE